MASTKESNIIGPTKAFDKRTIAGKRRNLAQMKAPDAMLHLFDCAVSNGISADYVLFDCWFSNPAQITAIKSRGMDVIAMVKKAAKFTMNTKVRGSTSNRSMQRTRNAEDGQNICCL